MHSKSIVRGIYSNLLDKSIKNSNQVSLRSTVDYLHVNSTQTRVILQCKSYFSVFDIEQHKEDVYKRDNDVCINYYNYQNDNNNNNNNNSNNYNNNNNNCNNNNNNNHNNDNNNNNNLIYPNPNLELYSEYRTGERWHNEISSTRWSPNSNNMVMSTWYGNGNSYGHGKLHIIPERDSTLSHTGKLKY